MAGIAEITRTYGGLEGRRVKAGTRFAIAKAQGGLVVITQARFQQLRDAGLAREEDSPAARAGTPPRQPGPVHQGHVKQKLLNESRTARKARNKNAGAPAEPRPLVNPAIGSQTTPVKLESLSPEAQASIKSNLGLRGRRKSPVSRSTTPGPDSPGPESSTPATAPGGVTIKDARNSQE